MDCSQVLQTMLLTVKVQVHFQVKVKVQRKVKIKVKVQGKVKDLQAIIINDQHNVASDTKTFIIISIVVIIISIVVIRMTHLCQDEDNSIMAITTTWVNWDRGRLVHLQIFIGKIYQFDFPAKLMYSTYATMNLSLGCER